MNYQEAKKQKEALEDALAEANTRLRVFPKGALGLTPDSVKASPEYKKVKAEVDTLLKRLQAFNLLFLKKFKKEYIAERRQRYINQQ